MKIYKNSGITLIALIITIIILIILAGITISLTIGNNGLINKTKDAKTIYTSEAEKEEILMAFATLKTDNIIDPSITIDETNLRNQLTSKGHNVTVSKDESENFIITFQNTNHEFIINPSGQIVGINNVETSNPSTPSTPEEPVVNYPEATDVYVTLCTDNILYFSNNNNPIEGKTVDTSYGNIKDSFYTSYDQVPWYQKVSTITEVTFINEIVPTSTMRWFCNFYNLTKINNIENLNTCRVTSMNCMFFDCYSLTSLDVSSFNTSNVTDMCGMFSADDNSHMILTEIKGLNNFNTSKVTDMNCMFYNCTELTSLDVSSFNTANVTTMRFMFGGGGTTSMSLNEIIGVESLNTSSVTNMDAMFQNCVNLRSLDLRLFNTSNVTDMYSMFYNCSSLTTLNISTFNTANVEYMDYMFYNCSKLTSLNLSSFNTSKVTSMRSMFCSCSKLTSLNLSSFDTSNVTDMSWMFGGNYSDTMDLTEIIGLTKFNTSNVINMNSMFYNCTHLTTLDLSSFNTSKVTNMGYMFGCNDSDTMALTTIYVGNNWNTNKVNTSSYMFIHCTHLVGGNNTAYSSSYTNKSRACIDTSSTPGYLTQKNS